MGFDFDQRTNSIFPQIPSGVLIPRFLFGSGSALTNSEPDCAIYPPNCIFGNTRLIVMNM
jgi:hypothetical protein